MPDGVKKHLKYQSLSLVSIKYEGHGSYDLDPGTNVSLIFYYCIHTDCRFSQFAYASTVCETDLVGVPLLHVNVSDLDRGQDGEVTVTIIRGNWNNSLAVR